MPRRKTAAERNAEIILTLDEHVDVTPALERYQQSWLSFFTIDGPSYIPVRDVRIEPASAYFNSFTITPDET